MKSVLVHGEILKEGEKGQLKGHGSLDSYQVSSR